MKAVVLPQRLARCSLALAAVLLAACGPQDVSFKADVLPILQQHCQECHRQGGEGQQKSGLLLTDYAGLMQGTRFGPVVKPGDSLTSTLTMLIEGRADPSIKMPHGKKALAQKEIELVRRWVEQGAKNN